MRLATLLLALGTLGCAGTGQRGLLVVEAPAGLSTEQLAAAERHLAQRIEAGRFDVRATRVDPQLGTITFTLAAPPEGRAAVLRALVERTGALRLAPIVEPDAAFAGAEDEREGMLQWRGMYPEGDPQRYHDAPAAEGGPSGSIRWYEDCSPRRPWIGCNARDVQGNPALAFTELDVEEVEVPASGGVLLRWKSERAAALHAYASGLGGVPLALVDDERIVVAELRDVSQDTLTLRWDCERATLEVVVAAWSVAAKEGRLAFRPRVLELR